MKRIFLTLAVASSLGLLIAFGLGWTIDAAHPLSDAARQQFNWHFLVAIVAAIVAMLVHAVALTYFMGTGRWIEETSAAYGLSPAPHLLNMRLKYRALPGMVLSLLLIIVTGAFGAMADPASNVNVAAAPTIHFALASLTLAVNAAAQYVEYFCIGRNGDIIEEVLAEVRRIRYARGLDTPAAAAN